MIAELGPRLVDAVGVRRGERVLDVAAGTGNAAVPAALAGRGRHRLRPRPRAVRGGPGLRRAPRRDARVGGGRRREPALRRRLLRRRALLHRRDVRPPPPAGRRRAGAGLPPRWPHRPAQLDADRFRRRDVQGHEALTRRRPRPARSRRRCGATRTTSARCWATGSTTSRRRRTRSPSSSRRPRRGSSGGRRSTARRSPPTATSPPTLSGSRRWTRRSSTSPASSTGAAPPRCSTGSTWSSPPACRTEPALRGGPAVAAAQGPSTVDGRPLTAKWGSRSNLTRPGTSIRAQHHYRSPRGALDAIPP